MFFGLIFCFPTANTFFKKVFLWCFVCFLTKNDGKLHPLQLVLLQGYNLWVLGKEVSQGFQETFGSRLKNIPPQFSPHFNTIIMNYYDGCVFYFLLPASHLFLDLLMANAQKGIFLEARTKLRKRMSLFIQILRMDVRFLDVFQHLWIRTCRENGGRKLLPQALENVAELPRNSPEPGSDRA